ncbi:hypothetical protein B0H16DRAFT_1475158 [Mycena metata]|uniref:Uncharacterized protein n=1 Tax=Mycena metata TaxID=1033252 RepID=A0AAD7HEW1_9AGAR|nr:hypothetical protein B0H16DRAFT_1475158 [Mycena metata]
MDGDNASMVIDQPHFVVPNLQQILLPGAGPAASGSAKKSPPRTAARSVCSTAAQNGMIVLGRGTASFADPRKARITETKSEAYRDLEQRRNLQRGLMIGLYEHRNSCIAKKTILATHGKHRDGIGGIQQSPAVESGSRYPRFNPYGPVVFVRRREGSCGTLRVIAVKRFCRQLERSEKVSLVSWIKQVEKKLKKNYLPPESCIKPNCNPPDLITVAPMRFP